MSGNNFLEKYNYGRCHLFSIVASELFHTDVTVLWDSEAYDEDLNVIPELCLVHAFITLNINNKKYLFDVNGLTLFEDYDFNIFSCNEALFEKFNLKHFKKISKQKKWWNFEENEVNKIKEFISNNFKNILQ
jgi:hypothetical protein